MERRIAELRDHIIVCGGGNTASHIAEELVQTRTPFVIIERDPAREEHIRNMGGDVLYIIGDASDEAALRHARIDTARGLVTCMSDDKDNLFTIFEARALNPSLRIVSRLTNDEARPKLIRAGANGIVPMQRIGALRIASEVLRPHVVSVLDVMLREPGLVRVQEMVVGAGAANKTLAALGMAERVGVTVFAMRDAESLRHTFNPPGDRVLREGDVLIGCAGPDQLEAAREVASNG